jgi:hypothetical protein
MSDTVKTRTAAVHLERAGLSVRVDGVPVSDVAEVAADLLDAFRLLRRAYPEVIADLGHVGGGTPVDVIDDDWAEEGRGRVGFRQAR